MRKYLVGVIALPALMLTSLGLAAGSPSTVGTSPSGAASAGTPTASGRCSKATALQVATPLNLVDTVLPNPIAGVLCGAFTGPGSQAMVATIAQGTCLPNSGWAVFRLTGGAWQLVPNGYHSGFVAALVAVGSDIRETARIWRKNDGPCNPTGGTKARIWHWDGSRLVASPWKQVTKGEPEPKQAPLFYSPSGNILCWMDTTPPSGVMGCQSRKAPHRVNMDANGRLKICDGIRCLGCGCDAPDFPTLAYGKQVTYGRFRCLSLEIGVRCTVIQSGKGFLINRDGVSRVGP